MFNEFATERENISIPIPILSTEHGILVSIIDYHERFLWEDTMRVVEIVSLHHYWSIYQGILDKGWFLSVLNLIFFQLII